MKKVLGVLFLIGTAGMVRAPGPWAQENQICSTAAEPVDYRPEDAAHWNDLKSKAIDDVQHDGAWSQPQLLKGAVNSIGWEDSPSIAQDGKSISFFYFPGDLMNFYGKYQGDPKRFLEQAKGPARGLDPGYIGHIFISQRGHDQFCRPRPFPYSKPNIPDFAPFQSAEGDWYYVSLNPADKAYMPHIFRNGRELNIPGKNKYHADNPHFIHTKFGRELFFVSDNHGSSKKRAWMTVEKKDGRWGDPVLLKGAVNLASADTDQPHLTPSGDLYFTSSRQDWAAVWQSRRLGYNAWSEPKKILWPKPGSRLIGVGEPTLTADGQWLYFVAVFQDENGVFDADIGRVKRL